MKKVTRQVLTAHILREHVEEIWWIHQQWVFLTHQLLVPSTYFVSSNIVIIFKIALMNDYLILNLSFLYDGKFISKLKFFFCNFN